MMKNLLISTAFCLVCSLTCTPAFSAPTDKKSAQPTLPELKPAAINVDGHPESVATDEKGNIYFTCVGAELKPTERDSDGYIALIPYGTTEVKKITEAGALHAPKGLIYKDGFLYCADLDAVHKIDAKDGKIVKTVSLAAMRVNFLNDLALINGRFMVSATDTDQLYYVDFDTCSYGEFIPKQRIFKPNGLTWAPDKKLIYVCEYDEDEKTKKPSGRLLSISPVTREVTEVSQLRGMYDGLAYRDNILYVSDWKQGKNTKAIQIINLKSGISKAAATAPIAGPADFTVYGNMLIVPGMEEKKIHLMPLGGKK